jgi:hypothetical protein
LTNSSSSSAGSQRTTAGSQQAGKHGGYPYANHLPDSELLASAVTLLRQLLPLANTLASSATNRSTEVSSHPSSTPSTTASPAPKRLGSGPHLDAYPIPTGGPSTRPPCEAALHGAASSHHTHNTVRVSGHNSSTTVQVSPSGALSPATPRSPIVRRHQRQSPTQSPASNRACSR